MNTDFLLRPLTKTDIAAFRTLRLEALRDNPTFFGTDFEEEKDFPENYFLNLLETNHWFGVFLGDNLVGMAALRLNRPAQLRHRAGMWGMYLQSAYRGRGAAGRLLTYIVDAAKENKLEQIELRVMEQNAHACRFYKKHGFKEIARTPQIIKLADGTYLDDFVFVRFLSE